MFCENQMIWYVKKCSVTHFATFQITARILRGWVCIWWRDLTKKRLISSLEWRVEVQKLMVGWGLQPKRKKATQSRKEWFFSLFSKINFICLFVCFWLCWTFIVARRLSLVWAHGLWRVSQSLWSLGLVAPWYSFFNWSIVPVQYYISYRHTI